MSPRPLNILYVITSLRTGGAERMVAELTKALIREEHRVEIFLFDSTETSLLKELEEAEVRIYKGLPGYYQMYNPLNIFRLRRLIKKNHYHIIHSHNFSAQLFLAIAGKYKDTKLVTTEHNSTNRRRNLSLLRPIDKWIYKKYDAVISVSRQVRENLLSSLRKKEGDIGTDRKFPVIYNGIDFSKFLSSPEKEQARDTDRDKLRIPDESDKNVILMLANFRKQKDHATAIRAMQHFDKNYVLWLAGAGETKKECESLAKNLKVDSKIRFLGEINDVYSLISKSKIVILSTNYEGLPVSAIEAMACGKPFIGSDVDGVREIVEDAGILFHKGNDAELAHKIQTLIDSPEYYKKVEQKCRQRAEKFNLSSAVKEHTKLYARLIYSHDNCCARKKDNYET